MSTATLNKGKLSARPKTGKMVTSAMLAAIAYVLTLVCRIPIWSFLQYEPKDVVIVIAGFIYGPFSAFLVSFVVSTVEMVTISDTGFIGMVMNVLATCSFACTAAVVYAKFHTKHGGIVGLTLGCIAMTAVMVLWNYLITPMYMETTREVIAAMLLPIFVPFNLFKSGLNMAIALILYKPVITALRRASLLPPAENTAANGKFGYGSLLLGTAMIATIVLIILAFKGII